MYRKELEMKRDEVFPSKYLKAADLNGKPVTVTIKSAPYEPFKNPEGKEQSKTVLYFVGGKKALPLNIVNWDSVAEICGDDTDAWPGHQLELYPTVTQMGAKTVPCIRIRRPQGTLPLAARPSATPAPMPAETPPVESNAGTDVSRTARPSATPAPMPTETPPVEAYADADFGDDLPEAFR
jgi:hypothetical protein